MTPQDTTAVHVEGLDRVFTSRQGTVTALQGVDLDVAPGEFVSLIGPSDWSQRSWAKSQRLARPATVAPVSGASQNSQSCDSAQPRPAAPGRCSVPG